MGSSPTTKLDYANSQPLHRRKWVRLGVIWAGVCLLLLLARSWVPQVRDRVMLLYRLHQCSTFSAPAGQVVYESDPQAVAVLEQANQGYKVVEAADPQWDAKLNLTEAHFRTAVWRPECQSFLRTNGRHWPLGSNNGNLFLHDRYTPSGKRRLVTVDAWVGPLMGKNREIEVQTFAPSSDGVVEVDSKLAGTPALALLLDARRSHLTLFAGRPDSADASGFTIQYTLNGKPGTIIGRLTDNNIIRLDLKEGSPVPRIASKPITNHSEDPRIFYVAPSARDLRELQHAVLVDGHQPWRLDPLEVAKDALRDGWLESDWELPPLEIKRDDVWKIERTANAATATWTGTRCTAVVVLSMDGIWFADRVTVQSTPKN